MYEEGIPVEMKTFTMRELLRMYYHALKDQIHHRMHFYKTGTLVKEGMIVVNSSGLHGDPTACKVGVVWGVVWLCDYRS